MLLGRNGINTAPAKGVAAEDAFEGQPAAFDRTVGFEARDAVLAAGWPIAATTEQMKAKVGLIEADQEDQKPPRFVVAVMLGRHRIMRVRCAALTCFVRRLNGVHVAFSPER